MSFRVVIPARYQSRRLPGKVLLPVGNLPMLQHVWNRACASSAQSVVIATDDERIQRTARDFGAEVFLSRQPHESGTERVREVVDAWAEPDQAIIINLQADEPLLPPALIKQAAEMLQAQPRADVATLCVPLREKAEIENPHVVKVICDRQGRALYFSRAAIPWTPDRQAGSFPYCRHIGLYAYRAGSLRRFSALPACTLECAEQLEQLRILYGGGWIQVEQARVIPAWGGVDTAEDWEQLQTWLKTEAGAAQAELNAAGR